MVKIRTVIPQNAKPGTSVIQVVNPKTNKPTRIRVPANAQPGQVIELELPDDSQKNTPTSATKLGGVPSAKSFDAKSPQDGSSYDKTRGSTQQLNPGKSTLSAKKPVVQPPPPSDIPKPTPSPSPPQYSINTPDGSKKTASQTNSDPRSEPGCCSSFFSNPFKWCGSMCS